jgi:hypothetical protein
MNKDRLDQLNEFIYQFGYIDEFEIDEDHEGKLVITFTIEQAKKNINDE